VIISFLLHEQYSTMTRFSAVALAALFGVANASMLKKALEQGMTTSNIISAESSLGKSILARSTKIRDLEDNSSVDYSWMTSYSLVFDKCHTLPYYVEGGPQYDNDKQAYSNPVGNQMLVTYKLCASDSCNSGCSGGEYVVEAGEFVQAYIQAEQQAQEQTCNMAKENCQYLCEYGKVMNSDTGTYYFQDQDTCLSSCYTQKGFDYCVESEAEDFNAYEYVACKQVKNNNKNNNNGNNVKYYAGVKCANSGTEVHMQMYSDENCSSEVDNSIYANLNYYGTELPYASSTLISNKCVSCKEQKDSNGEQNYYDANDSDEVAQLCANLYATSGHCESKLSGVVSSPKEDSCTFIESTLPSVNKAISGSSKSSNSSSSGGGHKAAVFFAWFFAFATAGLAYYVYFLIKKIKNANLASLDHQGGTVA